MEATSNYTSMGSQNRMHWLISAFLGFLFIGGGNFMISDESYLRYPYDLKLLVSIGFLIATVALWTYHMVELRIRDGICPSFCPSSIFTKENGFIPEFKIGILGGVFLFLAQFFLFLGWSYDPSGKSITFLSLCGIAPVTSMLSFIVFQEKLSFLQILGMILTIGGIVYLDAGNLEGTWISYVFGVSAMFSFSIRNLIGRAIESKGIRVYTSVMLNSIGEVLSGVVLLAWMAVYQGFNELFTDVSIFFNCLIGSVFVACALYFVVQAIDKGNIGVVVTVVNCNGTLFILLDYIVNDNIPSSKILMVIPFIIFGLIILLFGDQFKSFVSFKAKEKKILIL